MWSAIQTNENVKKEISIVEDELPMLQIKFIGEYGYMQERMNLQALDKYLKELQKWRGLLATATLQMVTKSDE